MPYALKNWWDRGSGGTLWAGYDYNLQECCCRVSWREQTVRTCSHSDSSLRGTCWLFSFSSQGSELPCNNWILPVVLRAGLATTSQLLANHLQLQSCSLATPRLSDITKVLWAKGKMKGNVHLLFSTTLASHPFVVCSLLVKCAGPCRNREGNGDCDLKTLP